jgi:uncharacterized membrane protein YphA (DoxX/SURF4 family)
MDGLWVVAEWTGRILLSVLFIASGVGHLTQVQGTTMYAQSKRVPAAKAAVVVTGVMILVGGGMILVNWHPIVGCLLLFVFLVPVAFFMHNFWTVSDPMMRIGERAHFLKDLALAGAALLYASMLHRLGVPL